MIIQKNKNYKFLFGQDYNNYNTFNIIDNSLKSDGNLVEAMLYVIE